MTAVWRTDIGPATKRLVLLALADAANDDGVCWPSMAHVARKAACGVSTARTAVADLEKAGYLRREERRVSNERNRSNIYHLDAARIWREAATEIQREVAPDPGGTPPEIWRGNPNTIPQEGTEEPSAAGAASATTALPSKAVVYSAEFEAAWKLYGRKGAKRTAWLEWQRAVKRAPVETIVAAIPAYLANKSDPKFRKDFERWLKGDVWESADAQPVGSRPDCDQAMSAEEADRWLFARFQEADAAAVSARTGREYRAPKAYQLAAGQTPEEYLRAHRAAWIKDNRAGLRRVLMGMQFKNGNEVQA